MKRRAGETEAAYYIRCAPYIFTALRSAVVLRQSGEITSYSFSGQLDYVQSIVDRNSVTWPAVTFNSPSRDVLNMHVFLHTDAYSEFTSPVLADAAARSVPAYEVYVDRIDRKFHVLGTLFRSHIMDVDDVRLSILGRWADVDVVVHFMHRYHKSVNNVPTKGVVAITNPPRRTIDLSEGA